MTTEIEQPFIDYYQILEIDLTAELEEIEQQFLAVGQRLHPDVPETGDQEQFDLLTQAFQTLRIPESRQEYDELLHSYEASQNIGNNAEIPPDATLENMDLEKEARDRIVIMQQFYERRRIDFRNPGLASGALDKIVECSPEMLEFQMWYCLAKGWLFREEGGQLTITADGVDHVEKGLKALSV